MITLTQYGAIGYEIISKYSNFRNKYMNYFKHLTKETLTPNHKMDLTESAFDLFLLLEGIIIKYTDEKKEFEEENKTYN